LNWRDSTSRLKNFALGYRVAGCLACAREQNKSLGFCYAVRPGLKRSAPRRGLGDSGLSLFSMLYENGALWEDTETLSSVLEISTTNASNAQLTTIAPVTGTAFATRGLAPDPLVSSAPEPGFVPLFVGALAALAGTRARSIRKASDKHLRRI
jgi:hypothetical protein